MICTGCIGSLPRRASARGDPMRNRPGGMSAKRMPSGKATDTTLRVDQLSSFGEDARGRVYAVSLSGPVYRLVAR